MPIAWRRCRQAADGRPGAGPGSRRPRGFTLLEVLVALVVLAVALTALLSAQALAVRLRSQAAEITFATFLAQSRLTDIELGEFPDVGTREGDFGDAYPGYRWQVAVGETPFPKVREVRLAVLWRSGPREERLELTHFLVDPK